MGQPAPDSGAVVRRVDSFESCAAIRKEVDRWGLIGIRLDGRNRRIVSDPFCGATFDLETVATKEYVRVKGRRCHVGYSCSNDSLFEIGP